MPPRPWEHRTANWRIDVPDRDRVCRGVGRCLRESGEKDTIVGYQPEDPELAVPCRSLQHSDRRDDEWNEAVS